MSSYVCKEGVIKIEISARIQVSELETWSPERIEKLFDGLAKIVAARDGLDPSAVILGEIAP